MNGSLKADARVVVHPPGKHVYVGKFVEYLDFDGFCAVWVESEIAPNSKWSTIKPKNQYTYLTRAKNVELEDV